jgi:hypothetical protein
MARQRKADAVGMAEVMSHRRAVLGGLDACQVANRVLAERYFELLKDAKVKGYLFAQQNYLDEPLKK